LAEKLPCFSCRTFFTLRAILYAYQRRIPYIVFCADPQQMLTTESDPREIVRSFYKTFGRDLTDELFAGRLEPLLFADKADLPKIVFPFVAMHHRYDPDRIVAELKDKGLYETSPFETHCTLFPLLNYYSFKHWDCMFYKLNASSAVRATKRNRNYDRSTFGFKFPGTIDLVEVEARFKRVLLEIAAGRSDPGEHEAVLIDVFRELGATEDAAAFMTRSCLNMRQVAAEMKVDLR
jgi:hypothetical protein